jgi:hypothetical protein
MSKLDDDIARGCLENGESIEARWGTGEWSEVGRQREPDPDFYGADCPYCGKEAIFVEFYGKNEFVECKHCGRKKMSTKPVSEMTDQEIDSALAEMLGWFVDDDRLDKIPYYISFEGKGIMPVSDWHPHDDLNQVWQCEEQIINNYNRTRSRPGRICDWYAVKLQEMLIPPATHSDIICGNDHELLIVHATARQKCEAMLMAMEENESKLSNAEKV